MLLESSTSFLENAKTPCSSEMSPLLGQETGKKGEEDPPALEQLSHGAGSFGKVAVFSFLLFMILLVSPFIDFNIKSAKLDFLLTGGVKPSATSIKVAFAGNSMQYHSDLPRLLEHMLRTRFEYVVQDSCFQAISTISSLWSIGNSVNETLHTDAARRPDGTYDIGAPTMQALLDEEDWDYLVLNDFTQSPARDESRAESKKALKQQYAPILRDKSTTLILLETAAYEIPEVHHTQDLGDFDEFTRLLHEGYVDYLVEVQQLNCSARLAPNALAFSYVRYHKPELFHMLYAPDHHHPSPHGTWMEACVVYCTMLGQLPPRYNLEWWSTSRYVMKDLPFPTIGEAEEIRRVAGYICQIDRNY